MGGCTAIVPGRRPTRHIVLIGMRDGVGPGAGLLPVPCRSIQLSQTVLARDGVFIDGLAEVNIQ